MTEIQPPVTSSAPPTTINGPPPPPPPPPSGPDISHLYLLKDIHAYLVSVEDKLSVEMLAIKTEVETKLITLIRSI